MPIDHLMIKVKDWPKAKAYYTAALKPLGYEPVADWGTGGGFGVPDQLGNIYVKQGERLAAIAFKNTKRLRLHLSSTLSDCNYAADTDVKRLLLACFGQVMVCQRALGELWC